MGRLDEKRTLITGAESGIGYGAPFRFAVEGASVMCADRDLAGAKTTIRMIEKSGGTAAAAKADGPDDITYAAVYLASDESTWVTGQVWAVDGGITAA